MGHKRRRKKHSHSTVHVKADASDDDDSDDDGGDDVSGEAPPDCDDPVIKFGVPVPNSDPACKDIIAKRRRDTVDKLKPFDPLKPFKDIADSFARLVGVSRAIVIFGVVTYGLHWISKRKRR